MENNEALMGTSALSGLPRRRDALQYE